jgi:tetratricopeptide (TPR) repeat protein
MTNWVSSASRLWICLTILCLYGRAESAGEWIQQGQAALSHNHFHEAARSFQKAIDLNPSSAEAHEGLGAALARQIVAGNVRPSNDMATVERAEDHLKQASDLSPSAPGPLIELSRFEAALAERTLDPSERAERYQAAQDLLRRVTDLQPGNGKIFLQLANLERDQFGPAIQQAKAQSGKTDGPIPDPNVRKTLQKQYGALIHQAIANAKQASDLNGKSARPLLLLSRILQERALIRDTQDQYAADMQSAQQWKLQFLAVGGHTGDETDSH